MNVLDLLRRRKHPTIFICYRRHGEGSGFGGRVADKLVSHFGPHQCFRDVENIETGADFVESINKAIAVCEVLVVVIGPDWVTQEDANNRPRVEDPKDFVRLEVSAENASRVYVDDQLVHRTDRTDRWVAKYSTLEVPVKPGPHLVQCRSERR